jgi:hypothetical protein
LREQSTARSTEVVDAEVEETLGETVDGEVKRTVEGTIEGMVERTEVVAGK